MTQEIEYISPLDRLKQERALKKAKKHARKEIEPQVGKKAAARLVKNAANRVAAKSMTEHVAANKITKAAARGG